MNASLPVPSSPSACTVARHALGRGQVIANRRPWHERAKELVQNALVPPVVAVLFGTLLGAAPPLRSVFVDTADMDNSKPLEFFFNAVQEFGQVPRVPT